MTEKTEIFTLHRYFLWADRMRAHMDTVIGSEPKFEEAEIDFYLYMSYWYGALYVVIEGWRELKLSDPRIDALLSSPNVDLLRRYRNAVFHYQREYFDPRAVEFFGERSTPAWVREIHGEFGRYFLEWFRSTSEEQ